tara:strand:+ start:246 stop:932 length:687 start_codon:yes stop_codon:yes gene_type:complete
MFASENTQGHSKICSEHSRTDFMNNVVDPLLQENNFSDLHCSDKHKPEVVYMTTKPVKMTYCSEGRLFDDERWTYESIEVTEIPVGDILATVRYNIINENINLIEIWGENYGYICSKKDEIVCMNEHKEMMKSVLKAHSKVYGESTFVCEKPLLAYMDDRKLKMCDHVNNGNNDFEKKLGDAMQIEHTHPDHGVSAFVHYKDNNYNDIIMVQADRYVLVCKNNIVSKQ